MNTTANTIKQRLSLRQPLQEALDIVAQLSDGLSLKKECDLSRELEIVRALYPSCTDFERKFPSLAFSIATGVGKTRLMGACIAYLFLEKGIRNFFVLAPNLTIYDKLIEDFGNPGYHKYVFHGISEFVHNRPVIITGDNYAQQGALFSDSEVRINIFNISKFNSENRGTRSGGVKLPPRIKRLSEYLGESYWSYLSNLDDLVILMDEAHRYHADASKNAINELKPVLGLELTATPIDEKGNYFQNVVYEYSLAQALADGKYVKNPAIATRKDFDPKGLDDKQIELIKLEDAVSIHEDTKEALELYSLNENVKRVKPFILVVCRDIAHAGEIYALVSSDHFFEGRYRDKVLQIDSSTRRDEDIERQFVSLESPDNDIEIVIHVNMLKEGWDVSNLYTIVPLRAANASVLVEQTIGRGLRLPYDGKRTGVDKVDKLTVVAHENFDSVIAAAQDPASILNKVSFIEIPKEELAEKTEVVTAQPVIQNRFEERQKEIQQIADEQKRQSAQNNLDARKAIINVLPDFNTMPGVHGLKDLRGVNVRKKVMAKIREDFSKGQGNLFAEQILAEADEVYETMVTEFENNIIEIPRMVLVQEKVKAYFKDFDLDVSEMNYRALDQEIIRMGLKDQVVETLQAHSSGFFHEPVKLIVAELINYPEVDYDENADLLYKLGGQAAEALKNNLEDPDDLPKVVFQFKAAIAEKIYDQMHVNFELDDPGYASPNVLPFVGIEPWNFSALINAGYRDYRDVITPVSLIPKLIFRGFQKACHFEYKFDSKTEQDMAFILENDKTVLKWLRPAPNQFRIYWDHNSKRYEPDFIAETKDTIYMLEPKRSDQVHTAEVQAKKEAAERYCKYASEYTAAHGGKSWKYGLVPHDAVTRTNSLAFLAGRFAR